MDGTLAIVTKTSDARLPASAGPDGDLRVRGLLDALGYHLDPSGLCRGNVCIPLRGEDLETGQGTSLAALRRLTRRPVVVDGAEAAVAIGEAADARAEPLANGLAPDFTLPDLAGRLHSLSEHRGRKVLLAAWASW